LFKDKSTRDPAEGALAEACGLTRRECEVLHWLAFGKRDREIAAILGIAVRTARKHVEHVRAKLHVETRMAAVAAAQHLLRAKRQASERRAAGTE
jgi:DNA-binding CsgD family transcriptional regulator